MSTKIMKKTAQSTMKHKMPSDDCTLEKGMEGLLTSILGARFPGKETWKCELQLKQDKLLSPSWPGIHRRLREGSGFPGCGKQSQTIEWAPKGQRMPAGVW